MTIKTTQICARDKQLRDSIDVTREGGKKKKSIGAKSSQFIFAILLTSRLILREGLLNPRDRDIFNGGGTMRGECICANLAYNASQWPRVRKILKKRPSVEQTLFSLSAPARQFFMSRLLAPTPCSFPRHSSVYRYSSVGPYLPATFQFHSTSTSALPPLPRVVQFWTT